MAKRKARPAASKAKRSYGPGAAYSFVYSWPGAPPSKPSTGPLAIPAAVAVQNADGTTRDEMPRTTGIFAGALPTRNPAKLVAAIGQLNGHPIDLAAELAEIERAAFAIVEQFSGNAPEAVDAKHVLILLGHLREAIEASDVPAVASFALAVGAIHARFDIRPTEADVRREQRAAATRRRATEANAAKAEEKRAIGVAAYDEAIRGGYDGSQAMHAAMEATGAAQATVYGWLKAR